MAVAYLVAELGASHGLELVARSGGLPIGAGLGSSAALGVACAAALTKAAFGVLELTHVNDWAFCAEVVQHGTPSGLDNAISCFGGGAIAKRDKSSGLVLEPIAIPDGLQLLITNTRVPRMTRDLVASVSSLLAAVPEPVKQLFAAVDAIALDFAKECQVNRLELRRVARLVELNHGILRALGVSHPALERVADTARGAHAAATKLTGAGGGGCAITLLHDARAEDMPPMAEDDVIRRRLMAFF